MSSFDEAPRLLLRRVRIFLSTESTDDRCRIDAVKLFLICWEVQTSTHAQVQAQQLTVLESLCELTLAAWGFSWLALFVLS